MKPLVIVAVSIGLLTGLLMFAGCRLGGLNACQLVTKAEAESILKRTAHMDEAATTQADRLSAAEPGVAGTCIYSTGIDETSPRLVVGYRVWSSMEEVQAGFDDSKRKSWKSQTQEVQVGTGDEAILLDGKLIALRKGKTWVQIGVTQSPPEGVSVEALKAVAQRVADEL
jgi:hypothetical protein